MPLVRFKATSDLPKWEHKKREPIQVDSEHGDTHTVKVRQDGKLRDQDIVEMTDFEAQWAISTHPDNFEIIEGEPEVDSDWVDPDDHLKDDLVEMAEDLGLEVDSNMTKREIADLINQEDS